MPRLELDFPEETFTFSTVLSVRFDDINIGNHLANERLVALIGEARSRFLEHRGIAELGSPGVIVGDLVVIFRAEARLRDRLRFDVGIGERHKYGGQLCYRVVREGDDTLIARAATGMLFFDYEQGRVTAPPEAFLA